jgi:predicted SAM-dependent methyltransferase
MPLQTLSLDRSLTSYARVRSWIGKLVRNRRFQLAKSRIAGRRYLDLGCGPNTHPDFINLDFQWHPGIDVCWDVTRGLPFAERSLVGVFSEHCLEHFPAGQARALLREVNRVLVPGGHLRLVVPDAELYLGTYWAQLQGDPARRFPYQAEEQARGLWTPLVSVNRVFYQDREFSAGHWQMYDFGLLEALLRDCGFTRVTRCRFGVGGDPCLLIDSPGRAVESLYVEAVKSP